MSDLLTHTDDRSAARLSPWNRLRERLLPSDDGLLMLSAHAMILTALVSFILLRWGELPPWRFYGAIVSLLALLALNIALPELAMLVGERWFLWTYLLLSGALFWLANWLGEFGALSVFLIFMLSAQAFNSTRFSYALSYSAALLLGLLAILWAAGVSVELLVSFAIQISLGLLFTTLFSIVLVRYREQKAQAEALLRDLQAANAELAATREREKDLAVAEERVRLARDIHDGLGHHLTVLNIQLQAAAKLVERDAGRAAAAIATCRDEAQAALDEVRRSVATMRRSPLDSRPLDQALAALVHDFDRGSPLEASFEQYGDSGALSPAAAMTLYRAAQEGLTNAQKHAAARRVAITLTFEEACVSLKVCDDGVGAGSASGSGFGLAGLRERAEQLGGDLSTCSPPKGGFELEMVLPTLKTQT
jgi:signal transduction histidine kinase